MDGRSAPPAPAPRASAAPPVIKLWRAKRKIGRVLRVSLWADWGDGPYNIADLAPKEVTPGVMRAIRIAFLRGVECQKHGLRSALSIVHDVDWLDLK